MLYRKYLLAPILSQIVLGYKQIEGRLYDGDWTLMKVGDYIKFYNDDYKLDMHVFVRIIDIKLYPTIEEMFKSENIKLLLPNIASKEDTLKIYKSMYKNVTSNDKFIALKFKELLHDIRENLSDEYKIIDFANIIGGFVFGGYIRDFINGDPISDIDVAIPLERSQEFYDYLVEQGYEQDKENIKRFTRKGSIPVEVQEIDGEGLLLGDFDVNLLAYDGNRLFDYLNEKYPISDIIENIIERKAKSIYTEKFTPKERIDKMKSKGYDIKFIAS